MTVGYLFDLDETLVVYEPGVDGIFANACEAVGCEATEASCSAFRSGYVETFAGFEEDPYVGAAREARAAGLEVDPQEFAAAYVEAELDAAGVPDGVVDFLASLERVGVVTNGYGPLQRRKLSEVGLTIDAVVCPGDVGAFKPDPAPFEAIVEAVPADEYVMIGDSVEYDIRPATRRGYRTVLIGDREPETSDVDEDLADYRLSGPSELPRLPEILEESRGF